jgi:addiction module RelE/StbE family toxin
MGYKLRYLDLAKNDVKEMKDYLAQFYPRTPLKFLAVLKEKITNLSDMPYMYETYSDNPDYRKLSVYDYLVFYKADEESKAVKIHRVLHGARDISRYLR